MTKPKSMDLDTYKAWKCQVASEWYYAHKEHVLEQRRRKRLLEPEKVASAIERARKKNPELYRKHYRIGMRRWRADNPGAARAISAQYRKSLQQRKVAWADQEIINTIYDLAVDIGLEVDHIVPIRGVTADGYRVSGLHWEANLQLLPAFENGSKGNRMRPHEQAMVEGMT